MIISHVSVYQAHKDFRTYSFTKALDALISANFDGSRYSEKVHNFTHIFIVVAILQLSLGAGETSLAHRGHRMGGPTNELCLWP